MRCGREPLPGSPVFGLYSSMASLAFSFVAWPTVVGAMLAPDPTAPAPA
jgi:hypothetical protein